MSDVITLHSAFDRMGNINIQQNPIIIGTLNTISSVLNQIT